MLTNAKFVELSSQETINVNGGADPVTVTVGTITAVAGLVTISYQAGQAVGEYFYNILN